MILDQQLNQVYTVLQKQQRIPSLIALTFITTALREDNILTSI